MGRFVTRGWLGVFSVVGLTLALGCDAVPPGIIDDILNGNGNGNDNDNDNVSVDLVELQVYATNTKEASGLALHPTTGEVYAVNEDGLFGPISQGANLSTMTPIGATNLDEAPFEEFELDSLVLAITNSGEFWIGSKGSGILAVVPPAGGPAEAFEGQAEENTEQAIHPETMAVVPASFQGPQMAPGNLLVGQDTDFDWLNAIDVEADRTVIRVDNPTDPENPQERDAHHLTFGLDGVLYSSRAETALTTEGIQTIATSGLPTPLPGTLGLKADSFVGLANGDLIIRGARAVTAGNTENGILIYSAADEETVLGVALPLQEVSEDDEMIITSNGDTVYLSLPKRNQIYRAIDKR